MTQNDKIYILEYNHKDPRGPLEPCNWNSPHQDALLRNAIARINGRSEEWVTVYATTNENYRSEFNMIKQIIINRYEEKPWNLDS